MNRKIFPLVLSYAVLGMAGVTIVWYFVPPAAGFDNFIKTAGVVVSLVLGVMSSHISMRNARLQAKAAEDLEAVKNTNAKSLADHQKVLNEQIEQLKTNLQKDIESHKAILTWRTEEIKMYISREINAYDELHKAALDYYRNLEHDLQHNESPEKLQSALKNMKTVEHYIIFVPEEYRRAWQNFLQHGYYMIKLTSANPPSSPVDAWEKGADGFREAFNKLISLQKNLQRIQNSTLH